MIDATKVNPDFDTVYSVLNGNLDNTNISNTVGIYASQIIPTTSGQATFGGSLGYIFYPNVIGQVPITINGASGQTADLFDVFLTQAGTKAAWIDNVGFVHAAHFNDGGNVAGNQGASYFLAAGTQGAGTQFAAYGTTASNTNNALIGSMGDSVSGVAGTIFDAKLQGGTGLFTVDQNGNVGTLGSFKTGSSVYGASAQTFAQLTTAGVLLNSAAGVVSSSAGPLAVANGGTGSATQNFVDLTTNQTITSGTKTFAVRPASAPGYGDGGNVSALTPLSSSLWGLSYGSLNSAVNVLAYGCAADATHACIGGSQGQAVSGVTGNVWNWGIAGGATPWLGALDGSGNLGVAGSFKTGYSTYGPTSATVNGTLVANTSSDSPLYKINGVIWANYSSGDTYFYAHGAAGHYFFRNNANNSTEITFDNENGNITSAGSFLTGSSTYGATSATVAGGIQSLSSGSTTSFIPPMYNADGTAKASTAHTAQGTCAFAASTTCTPTAFSGAAVFASATSYTCSADWGSAAGATWLVVQSKSTTGITLLAGASNSNTATYVCTGT